MRLTSLTLIFIALICSIASNATRIEKPTDPNFRCSKTGLLASECEENRKDAIEVGCISREELDELIGYNGCPVCDRRGRYLGWCPVGCFVRGTKILVWDTAMKKRAWTPIEEIVQNRFRYEIAALKEDATLSSLEFNYLPIRLTTVGPERKPLVIVKTRNERSLGITSTHAVPLSNGMLVAAETLKVGDELLALDGSTDIITELTRPNTEDVVFNLSVESDVDQSHLIIAGGLLTGDQFLQGSRLFNFTILK